MQKAKTRLIYFQSHPIQYFVPMYKALNNYFDLHVYYFSDCTIKGLPDKGFGTTLQWDTPLLDGYSSGFIKNYSWHKSVNNHFLDLLNPGLIKILKHDNADIVLVNGWRYFSVLLTIVIAKILGKKVWLSSENPYFLEREKNAYLLQIKKMVLSGFLFPLIDKFIFIGTESKAFFKFYGVPDSKLIFAPYSVDNEFFNKQFLKYKNSKTELKKQFSLLENYKVILFIGKFIPVKDPLLLLQTYQKLNNENVYLIMVGEGALRREMEDYIAKYTLRNVILTGFINQSEISKYYAIADMLVVSSESETWGLAINEAMNFGLPILASDRVASAKDLIKEGINGSLFSYGDAVALAEKISYYLLNPELTNKAKSYSLQRINDYSVFKIAENLYEAS